ncbi:hypothetical protein Tco_1156707 [Tanacetum coccineum]
MDDLICDRNAKLAAFQQEIDTLKETLSNNVKQKESLSQTLTIFKTESKEKESKYIDKEIILEKQNKELENIICKMYRSMQAIHMLTKPQVFYDDTRKQALGYQNPFHLKKAQRIQPTLYDGSVIAKEHAVISVNDDEETLILEEGNKAFWLRNSTLSETPITSHTPVRIEAPSELPKVSFVNESLKKLKYQLANVDKVVKKRLTSDAITVGSWGFKHTKECFLTEIIPFLKVLKDTFNAFDKTLLDEITKVQTVFNQMEAAVDQCSVDKNVFEIQIKQLRIDNDQLLNQIMSQEIVHIVANSMDICDVKKSWVNDCKKCLELEIELFKKKDFVEKEAMINLENSGETLNAPTFNQLFKINELKAQSQEKDRVIRKLKERIKSLSEKDSVEKVKKDIDEIETINIEQNKGGQNYAQLQEKVFAIIALKNELRKLKGKNVVNTVVSKPNATLAPGMFKLDIEPISARLKNNRDAHEVYIDKTIEYADTLCGFVERARTQYPSKPLLESACMFTKHVQELLVYASQTCPNSPNLVRMHLKETTPKSVETSKPEIKVYSRRPKQIKSVDVPSSSCLVNDRLSRLFSGTVRFRNDQIAKIMGYGDYKLGNIIVSRVYYVEELGHSLFSVR